MLPLDTSTVENLKELKGSELLVFKVAQMPDIRDNPDLVSSLLK